MTGIVGSRGSRFSEPLKQVAALVESYSGLTFEEAYPRQLGAAVAARMDALALQHVEDYLSLLQRPIGDELQCLVEAVANGETAFFRNTAHYRALRETVLPTLVESIREQENGSARPIVLWSAGCATGEEAYSLAITCAEAGVTAILPVSILGTDISRRALQVAERGEYRDRDLTRVGSGLRDRYFERTPTGRWRVRDVVRSLVSWAPHNLLDTQLPVAIQSVDVLFCQNVAIYFRAETVAAVMARLVTALREGGYFFPGFSEMPWCKTADLEMVSFGDCFAYRKVARKNGAALRGFQRDATGTGRANATRRQGETGRASGARGVQGSSAGEAKQIPVADRLDAARRQASAGEVAEALAAVREVLSIAPMLPEGWELYGLLLRQAGRYEEAEKAFRRQLYLAPDSALPHFHLATLFRERGWEAAARREYGRVVRILERMPAEAVVAGVPVHLLLRACRSFVSETETMASD